MAARTKITEAELCGQFIKWLQQFPGWTVYAETGGWDMLLVRGDGVQLGIQAKLQFNATLLRQTLPARWDTEGPDYRAILLPTGSNTRDVRDVCQFCGIVHIYATTSWFHPGLDLDDWPAWCPKRRIELPEFVPDVTAGASAPLQLTNWKIRALRLCARLEINGHVTAADFKRLALDKRRWVNGSDWLRLDANGEHYTRGRALRFDKQHPEVFKKILSEERAEAQQ